MRLVPRYLAERRGALSDGSRDCLGLNNDNVGVVVFPRLERQACFRVPPSVLGWAWEERTLLLPRGAGR